MLDIYQYFSDLLQDLEPHRVDRLVSDVEKIVGDDGLGLLIHNAGTNPKNKQALSRQLLSDNFTTNVFGPILLTKVRFYG